MSATIGTILVILFGEIVPKKVAILFPVSSSRGTAHLLEICRIIFFPVLLPVLYLNKLLDKIKKDDGEEHRRFLQEEIVDGVG